MFRSKGFQFLRLSENPTVAGAIIAIAAIVSHFIWNLGYVANNTMVSVIGRTPEERGVVASGKALWNNVGSLLFSYVGLPFAGILAGIVGRPATVYLTDYVHAHAQIDAFALIADPTLQDWVVSDADGASYNDILELAQAVVTKIPQCDGKNGRPNPEQALDFFSKVIDLGGGAHFAPHYCLKGEVRDFFKKNRPDYISQNEWSRRINQTLIKYKENDYIS